MTKYLLLLISILFFANLTAQELYIKTFGNQGDTPLVFLHGGPGYNCATFEATTAQNLADEGYFVITYDRRGEGRSAKKAKYTFDQTSDDLAVILDKYDIEKVSLLAHSFGGMVAVNFAEKYPDRVSSVVLIAAPLNMQPSFKNVIAKSEALYKEQNNQMNLGYVQMLKTMDTTSLEYSSYSFMHAMQNGFYTPENIRDEAKPLYQKFATDTVLKNNAQKMDEVSPRGFWRMEGYTYTDYTPLYHKAKDSGVKFYGIYGKEDGLFSADQVSSISGLLGTEKVKYLDDCSHSVYIDRQDEFILSLNQWLK
jgi:proline iminopeptidase